MPTKTDRILGYLPSTFRPARPVSALRALADAAGGELQRAENILAELMAAHWVDHADRGAAVPLDLAAIGALAGLAPRPDETAEEFRRHLKRYVRIFLDGTSTVRGVLRIAAEALGIEVADRRPDLITWDPAAPALTTAEPRGDDATRAVFGWPSAAATGRDATAATLAGGVDLAGPVPLGDGARLVVAVDGGPAVALDLGAAPTPEEVVAAVDGALGAPVARLEGGRLRLVSPTPGAAGSIVLDDDPADAASALLGIAPRRYGGAAASGARLVGLPLPPALDLSDRRFLRVATDGRVAEVDCAGPDPAATTPAQVRDAVNAGLAAPVAGLEGTPPRLVLTSAATGVLGSVEVRAAAAQDAAELLFTGDGRYEVGADPRPATVAGTADLGSGVDLSANPILELAVDGGTPVRVDCSRATTAAEVVAAVDAEFPGLAVTDGRRLTLTSPTTGPDALIEIGSPDGDAAEALLGLRPRAAVGDDAAPAVLTGTADLRAGTDLLAVNVVAVAVDGAGPVEVDLRAGAADPRAVTRDEMVAAVNAALGAPVAAPAGTGIRLTSPETGAAGVVAVHPPTRARTRHYVTRAPVLTEASAALLGFPSAAATGTAATPARLRGTRDLRAGVDLGGARFLRLAVDDGPAVDIDCAGPRPHATLVDEVVAAVNAAVGRPVAAAEAGHLILTSPTTGRGSRLALAPPAGADARPVLFGAPARATGSDPAAVRFVGTADVSGTLDLSGGATVRLTVDGQTHEVDCAGIEPAKTGAAEVVAALNAAFARPVADRVDNALRVTSAGTGPDSEIAFAVPAAGDATPALFGISAPRRYTGRSGQAAAVVGAADLSHPVDLRTRRLLTVSVDGGEPVVADCAAAAANAAAVTAAEIVEALTAQVGGAAVSTVDGHLRVASGRPDATGAVEISATVQPGGDARPALLGAAGDTARGTGPARATLAGTVAPAGPVDLGDRSLLRLRVDGAEPVDVDVAGADPTATTLAEVVARLDAYRPGIASVSAEGRLTLSSPTAGADSRIAVLPLRYVEVREYLDEAMQAGPREAAHGDRWWVSSASAGEQPLDVLIEALHGAVGPALVRADSGWRVRIAEVLRAGESVRLRVDPDGRLHARVYLGTEPLREVGPERILAGTGPEPVTAPFDRAVPLADDGSGTPKLVLADPAAPRVVALRARTVDGGPVTVRAVEAVLPTAQDPGPDPDSTVLHGRLDGTGRMLRDAAGADLARLLPGPGIALARWAGRVVRVGGVRHAGSPPMVLVQEIANLFDVAVTGPGSVERFAAVTLGAGSAGSLVGALYRADPPSTLLRGWEADPAAGLAVPPGRGGWRYLECDAARFDAAAFGGARFAGLPATEPAVFDASRFALAGGPVTATFAGTGGGSPTARITLRWTEHRAGSFEVNLPADLPARFGGRFDSARFAASAGDPERYEAAVIGPPDDPFFLPTLISAAPASLVTAGAVAAVPAGQAAVALPVRHPRRLRGGGPATAAALYLTGPGLDGAIRLAARQAGAWGNDIEVSARPAGPARYDVTVVYAAARFECAREAVRGRAVPAAAADLLRPGPVGVSEAKAAGMHAEVARDRATTFTARPAAEKEFR